MKKMSDFKFKEGKKIIMDLEHVLMKPSLKPYRPNESGITVWGCKCPVCRDVMFPHHIGGFNKGKYNRISKGHAMIHLKGHEEYRKSLGKRWNDVMYCD